MQLLLSVATPRVGLRDTRWRTETTSMNPMDISATNRHEMKTRVTTETSHSKLEPWVNTTAACVHLNISIPTIRRWIKAGKLKPKRTPTGEFRFRLSELDSILN